MEPNTFKKLGAALAATLAVSAAGYKATAQRESPKGVPPTVAYQDVGGVETICHGHIKGVTKGMRVTLGQCEQWLKEDLTFYGKTVSRLIKQPITQEQYDVLTDFTLNKGVGAFTNSTLLKKVNTGNCFGAADEFLRWDKVCKTEHGIKTCRAVDGLKTAAKNWRTKFLTGCER